MSIPVDVDNLGEVIEHFGPGYLLTTSEGTVKAVTVEPTEHGTTLVVAGPGRGSLRNAAANAAITLLFPPTQLRGFTLLIDGRARVDGEDLRVVPESAVLHRPAAHSDGPPAPAGLAPSDSSTGCGDDCHPVG